MLNENKIDHMCQIMHDLHKYVPTIVTTEEKVLPTNEVKTYDIENQMEILAGGDQLTVNSNKATIINRDPKDT